jgi:hypothetical protein
MLTTTLTNLSPLPRQHWATVTYPTNLVAAFGVECVFIRPGGQEYRAVRGSTKGGKTVYRIRAFMEGSERLTGQLANRPHVTDVTPWTPHPWTADDLPALVPNLGILEANGVQHWDQYLEGPLPLEQGPAHQRWILRKHIPALGVVFEWVADLLHNDPVMPVYGKIVWSARNDPRPNRTFQHLVLRAGELVVLDFARRHGALQATQDPITNDWPMLLNTQPLTLNDGAGLPLSGVMLSFQRGVRTSAARLAVPSPTTEEGEIMQPAPDLVLERGLRDLNSAMHGPIVGVCHHWEGNWLGNKNVPRLALGATLTAERDWQQFVEAQQNVGGWFAPRPVGSAREPGQTGDQEDFGATKGTHIVGVSQDPRHIRVLQYSVQGELFRGVHHYEQDRTPLNLANHPNWVTWDSVTHFHTGVSQDRLGKDPLMSAPPGTGWRGYDDEHRSQNNLAAYLMLTDDPLMEDHLRFQEITDRACYRMRFPQFGNGAARAQGRTFGAWANFPLVTAPADAQKWKHIIDSRLATTRDNWMLRVSGPMRVLAFGNPDPRKQIYNADGTLGRWASMWEHGLAVIDLYKLHKQGYRVATDLLQILMPMLAEFACFQATSGVWYTVDDILYQDNGIAPPSPLVPGARFMVANPGSPGVGSWTLAGLIACREFFRDNTAHPGLRDKLDRYIAALTGSVEALDRRTAEWFATARTMTPPS